MAQTKRDCEYKRFGSSELLAALDLLTGKAFPLAGGTHKSADFIEFLKMLDAFYPEGDIIRLVLDNLAGSIGIRKHGRPLAASLSRFQFVFRHELKALRLNLIDELFQQDDAAVLAWH